MAMSQDGLFEILSWLPAKAIYKSKFAGKLFSEISKNPYFALKQAQNALTKDDSSFFIQPALSQRYNNGYIELHPLPGEDLSSGVRDDVTRFLSNSAKIISSSNGLILCRSTSPNQVELFVSNPATKSCLVIPTPKHLEKSVDADLKIGFDCNSSGCMVSLFDDPYDWAPYLDCKVYYMHNKEGTWRTKEALFFTGGRDLRFDMPVYYNGAIHVISDCFPYFAKGSPYFRPYIVSYNFENGISRLLRLPKEARRGSHDKSCDMRIFKWGKVNSSTQSICLVRLRKCVFTIWILTNYDLSLWRRILKVRVKGMGLLEQDPVVTGFKVLNGDLLVFATEKKVYSYGLTSERYMILEEICEHGCESSVSFISYSNTLRPCGIGAKTLPFTSTNHSNEECFATTSSLRGIRLISLGEVEQRSFCLFLFMFVSLIMLDS